MNDLKTYFLRNIFILIIFAKIQQFITPIMNMCYEPKMLDNILSIFCSITFFIVIFILGFSGKSFGRRYIIYTIIFWGFFLILSEILQYFIVYNHTHLNSELANQIADIQSTIYGGFYQTMFGYLYFIINNLNRILQWNAVFIVPFVISIVGYVSGSILRKIKINVEKIDVKLKFIYWLSLWIFLSNIIYRIIYLIIKLTMPYYVFSFENSKIFILVVSLIILFISYKSARKNNKLILAFSILYWGSNALFMNRIFNGNLKDLFYNELINKNIFLPVFASFLGFVFYYLINKYYKSKKCSSLIM